jgi:ABC-type multidrug transport system permease subunit
VKRFFMLLSNEFRLFRTTIPIHLIGIFQPTLMFSLIAFILVKPAIDMRVAHPTSAIEEALIASMEEVGSPIGERYIKPIVADTSRDGEQLGGQLIVVETVGGRPTAVQYFGLIDSNLVKNYRNRLTASALTLWDASLGSESVVIDEHPWLAHDIPYTIYFGMAMLSLAASMAAAIIGACLTAQEFEFNTILEYRLAPIPASLILGARLVRLSLTGLLSAGVLVFALGLASGIWPTHLARACLVALSMGLLGACLGTTAGLILKSTLPAFVTVLAVSFFIWILGSAFGLSVGFGGLYETVSRWMPNTYATELLFPLYYHVEIGAWQPAALALCGACVVMILITMLVYRQRVLQQQR